MKKLLSGIRHFQGEVFSQQRSMFEELAKGQKPETLFISCSDSRIVPSLFTQSEPGSLFEIQNAGNLVPPYSADTACGIAATIEYAVAVLGVSHVVVCGHSHCGAMTALFRKSELAETPAIAAWLGQAERTRRLILKRHGSGGNGAPGPELVRSAVEANVLAQLDNLRTHPSVAVALEDGELQLHAWVYHFELGEVQVYDPAVPGFGPLPSAD